jgi:hypothetical protein
MRMIAQPSAVSPLSFGRRRPAAPAMPRRQGLGDDARLFLWTFAAGFLAVSIYLA